MIDEVASGFVIYLGFRLLHSRATGIATLQSGLIVEPFAASGAEILSTGCALGVVGPRVSPHAVGTCTQVSVRVVFFHLCVFSQNYFKASYARGFFMARLTTQHLA